MKDTAGILLGRNLMVLCFLVGLQLIGTCMFVAFVLLHTEPAMIQPEPSR